MIDFKLNDTAHIFKDISFVNGDIETTRNLDTAVLLSIFCERRADSSEVPIAKYRRGWIGNILMFDSLDEMGSKLWLLYQARATQNNLNRAKKFITDALEWMTKTGKIRNAIINVNYLANNAMNINIKLITFRETLEYNINYGF